MERGRTLAEFGEDIAELVLEFLHSHKVREAGLSEWNVRPTQTIAHPIRALQATLAVMHVTVPLTPEAAEANVP